MCISRENFINTALVKLVNDNIYGSCYVEETQGGAIAQHKIGYSSSDLFRNISRKAEAITGEENQSERQRQRLASETTSVEIVQRILEEALI